MEQVSTPSKSQPPSTEKTLLFVGSRGAGKSSLVQLFLERDETVLRTLGLDYCYARRSGRSLHCVCTCYA